LTQTRERLRPPAAIRRGQEWLERQDPSTRPGVAIDAWRRYRGMDGPLQSALLSLYVLIAVVPALLVMEEYLEAHPAALANHLAHHYGGFGVVMAFFFWIAFSSFVIVAAPSLAVGLEERHALTSKN
jgi:uncharacterized BrkB/YihY/UPF0761 family membrane protein